MIHPEPHLYVGNPVDLLPFVGTWATTKNLLDWLPG